MSKNRLQDIFGKVASGHQPPTPEEIATHGRVVDFNSMSNWPNEIQAEFKRSLHQHVTEIVAAGNVKDAGSEVEMLIEMFCSAFKMASLLLSESPNASDSLGALPHRLAEFFKTITTIGHQAVAKVVESHSRPLTDDEKAEVVRMASNNDMAGIQEMLRRTKPSDN
jgi:hypothetical protein